MKTFLSTLALVALTAGAATAQQTRAEYAFEYCEVMGEIAELTMSARQDGLSIGEWIDIQRVMQWSDRELRMIQSISAQAWRMPRYYDAESVSLLVAGFGDWTFISCYDNLTR